MVYQLYRELLTAAHGSQNSPFHGIPWEIIQRIAQFLPKSTRGYIESKHPPDRIKKQIKIIWELTTIFSEYQGTVPAIINKDYTASPTFHDDTQWIHFRYENTPAGLTNSVNSSAAYYLMLDKLGDYDLTEASLGERTRFITDKLYMTDFRVYNDVVMASHTPNKHGGDWCVRLVMKNAIYILYNRERYKKFIDYKAWFLRSFVWKDFRYNNVPMGERMIIKEMVRGNMASVYDGVIKIL